MICLIASRNDFTFRSSPTLRSWPIDPKSTNNCASRFCWCEIITHYSIDTSKCDNVCMLAMRSAHAFNSRQTTSNRRARCVRTVGRDSVMTCCVLDACEQTRHRARVPTSSTRCGDRACVERVGKRGAGRNALSLKFLQDRRERQGALVSLCLQGDRSALPVAIRQVAAL